MAALHTRDASGVAMSAEVAVQESVAFTEWKSPIYYQASGTYRVRGGTASQWTVIRCRDGFVGLVYRDSEWPGVQRLIGEPALYEDRFGSKKGRLLHRSELQEVLESWAVTRTKTEIYHAAQACGVPAGMVRGEHLDAWRGIPLLRGHCGGSRAHRFLLLRGRGM